MLRRRLITGLSLALGIIALVLCDGWLSEMRARPSWALPGVPVELGALAYNGGLTTLIVLTLTLLAGRELLRFARAHGYRPFGWATQIFAAGLVVGPYLSFNFKPASGWADESWGLLWIATAVALCFFLQAVRRGTENVMLNLATTLFILFYTGGLSGFMTKLRMEVGGFAGVALLLFTNLVVKMTDTGAYFVGMALGRHKMIEWLSPKKTWEGFVGGMLVAATISYLGGVWLEQIGAIRIVPGPLGFRGPLFEAPLVFVLFGVFMGLFAVAGDLCASLLKRDAAMKDSGHSLPGLGGVLDVLDSPLLAAPAAWFFWTRIVQIAPLAEGVAQSVPLP